MLNCIISTGNCYVEFYITAAGYKRRGYTGYTVEEATALYCSENRINPAVVNLIDIR